MATEHKFDIFAVLKHLTDKQEQFVDNLTEEDLKALHPLVLMRWMSGTSSKVQVYALNEIANVLVFPLTKHKRLLLKVLMVCAAKNPGRYSWIKQKSSGSSKPLSTKVVGEYFKYPKRKAASAVSLIPDEDIVDMAEEMGYQPNELQKLHSEHKAAARAKNTKAPD